LWFTLHVLALSEFAGSEMAAGTFLVVNSLAEFPRACHTTQLPLVLILIGIHRLARASLKDWWLRPERTDSAVIRDRSR
jgi:hypothetical protein